MTSFLRYNTTTGLERPTMNVSGTGIPDLIAHVESPLGIEIGTDLGYTAEYLLQKCPNLYLHCIDPYSTYTDWNGNYLNDREDVFQSMLNKLSPFAERFTIHRQTSDDAAHFFIDDQFDFVFVDGLHTYEQVLKDCRNYYSKVKKGGLFCGHDYNAIEGVRRAADEFAAEVGKQILQTHSDVWYWTK